MKKLAIGLLLLSLQAVALTDFACVSRCTATGQSYGLCQTRCSANDEVGQAAPIRTTDYVCMNQCTAGGNMLQVCQARCSY